MFLLPLHPLHSLFHQKKDPEIETDFKMPFRDPLLDGYNCPVLLRSNMHREHVLKSESQEPKLPPYMSVSLYEENQLRKFLLITLIELCWSNRCGP